MSDPPTQPCHRATPALWALTHLVPRNDPLQAAWQLWAEAVNARGDDFRADKLLHDIKHLIAAQQLKHRLASVVAAIHWAPDFGAFFPDRVGAVQIVLVFVQLRDLAFCQELSCLLVDRIGDLLLQGGDVLVRYEILHQKPSFPLKRCNLRRILTAVQRVMLWENGTHATGRHRSPIQVCAPGQATSAGDDRHRGVGTCVWWRGCRWRWCVWDECDDAKLTKKC